MGRFNAPVPVGAEIGEAGILHEPHGLLVEETGKLASSGLGKPETHLRRSANFRRECRDSKT